MSELNEGQQVAFDGLVSAPQGTWSIVKSPAGYGKTFTLAKVLKQFQWQNCKILGCAPTHQAVQIMKKFAQENGLHKAEITTIDSALALRPSRNSRGSKESSDVGSGKIGKFDIIWIDEASMIDNFKWLKIKEKVNRNSSLIFTCDEAQFAPVSAKNPMLFSPVITAIDDENQYTLTQPMRTQGYVFSQVNEIRNKVLESIAAYQEIVRTGSNETLPVPTNIPVIESASDFCFVRNDETVLKALLVKALSSGKTANIIAYRNDTVAKYNREIRHMVKGVDAPEFMADDELITKTAISYGDDMIPTRSKLRVISADKITKETYFGKELVALTRWELSVEVDGKIYDLCPVAKEDFDMAVYYLDCLHRMLLAGNAFISAHDFGELCNSLCIDDTDNHERGNKSYKPILSYGYAITAHQSQGSTYDCSIVHMKDLKTILYKGTDKNLRVVDYWRSVYVAASRTSKVLYLHV